MARKFALTLAFVALCVLGIGAVITGALYFVYLILVLSVMNPALVENISLFALGFLASMLLHQVCKWRKS